MTIKSNLNVSGWSLDRGYTHLTDDQNYPLQGLESGFPVELWLDIMANANDIEYRCNPTPDAFKLILSTPGDALKLSQDYIHVQYSSFDEIHILPEMTKTSDELHKYTLMQRKCFYQSERQLAFYRIYSQINCEEECLTNFTRKECGCVGFWMPSK